MSYDFKTTTHAKWILAGEHSVVRGGGALVFPLPLKTFELAYKNTTESLTISATKGNNACNASNAISEIALSIIEKGMSILNKSVNSLTGKLYLKNNIPIGAGLGASAALSAAITKWFIYLRLVHKDNFLPFAKQLEDLFHGKSSGLDIIGATTDKGVYFQKQSYYPIEQTFKPIWGLSYCSQIGITSDCIQKVQKLWQQDVTLAKRIDETMQQSVNDALKALTTPVHVLRGAQDSQGLRDVQEIQSVQHMQGMQHAQGALGLEYTRSVNHLKLLANAINTAHDCFDAWGLINNELSAHIKSLRDQGAIAAKPTGSGHGGYVVSLWDKIPTGELRDKLIVL